MLCVFNVNSMWSVQRVVMVTGNRTDTPHVSVYSYRFDESDHGQQQL